MATINYLPSFPISDRVFPCPRKHMLIYGQKPSSPPPATLTQEQLARDAGQLVEAHALLDKLCDDTDRSQHSLVHRLKQIVYGSEEMNKVLEKAGFNTAAGLLECVRALAQRQKTTKETLDQVEARALGYQLEITRLKERNKRLHEAQGSGSELAQVRDVLSTITSKDAQTALGMAKTVVTMNLNQRTVIQQLREGAAADPIRAALRKVAPCNLTTLGMAESAAEEIVRLRADDLSEMVQACHNAISVAGHSPEGRTLLERVHRLIYDHRNYTDRQTSLLREVGILLDRAGIPNGTLCERVRVAIERGQQAKVAPDAAHCVNVVEECVRKLNEANVICVPLPDRIQHLLDERAAVRRDLLNLAAVTATADSNRTLAVRAVNRVTTMEKTIVAFANSPSVKELL
jgi:hypothetical protein